MNHDDAVIEHPGATSEMSEDPKDEMRDYSGSNLLAGKKALITGGDSGIGRAVAVAFAKEGADVGFAYVGEREDEDAAHTESLVRAAGRTCVSWRVDLGEPQACHDLVRDAASALGGIDVLVNNVATQEPVEDFADLSDEQWERTFAVNVGSYFRVTKAALEHLPEGAAIINTASINGLRGNKSLIDYSATKGAVIAHTYSLAQSLLERGIRVDCVARACVDAAHPRHHGEGQGRELRHGRPVRTPRAA